MGSGRNTVVNTTVVRVRRHWNDSLQATVERECIAGLHISETPGGEHAGSLRFVVTGYVWCDALIKGNLSHTCQQDDGPHRIKVVMLAEDNLKSVMRELETEAAFHSQSSVNVPRS